MKKKRKIITKQNEITICILNTTKTKKLFVQRLLVMGFFKDVLEKRLYLLLD